MFWRGRIKSNQFTPFSVPKRNIHWEIPEKQFQGFKKAIDKSPTLSKLVRDIEQHEERAKQEMFRKAQRLSERARGPAPKNYLHPGFEAEKILAVMERNIQQKRQNSALGFLDFVSVSQGDRNYTDKGNQISVVSTDFEDAPGLAHELQHARRNQQLGWPTGIDEVVAAEKESFTTQLDVAKELQVPSNVPFDDASAAAESYRQKGPDRFKKII
jgi:hypothetical protein